MLLQEYRLANCQVDLSPERRRELMNTRCILFLLTILFAFGVRAQDSGSITGQVLDASGGAVADAEVVIANIATGSQFSTNSDRSGFYRAPQVLPGEYTIT